MARVLNERGVRDFIRAPEEWLADDLATLRPGPLYVWGNGTQLYLLSGRAPASRYLNAAGHLGSAWVGRDQVRAELMAELARSTPAVVAVQLGQDPEFDLEGFAALRDLLAREYEVQSVADRYLTWRVYVRRG